MENWNYEGAWGATAGLMGQYDFKDWLALRVEANWAMKNHRMLLTGGPLQSYGFDFDYETKNHYVQVPVMASLSIGSRWRGFLNAGVYCAYWCDTKQMGKFPAYGTRWVPSSHVKQTGFDQKRDQRLDFGLVGGIGGEWQCCEHIAFQAEARCYYSTTSAQKDYMRIKDPRYNTTYVLQGAICYIF